MVVLGADGVPYWAWTGTDTQVRFGGAPSDDGGQTAALHEPMTWSVLAVDGDGVILAVSERVPASP